MLCKIKVSHFRHVCNFRSKVNVCFVGMFVVDINKKVLISVSNLSLDAAIKVNSGESIPCCNFGALHTTIILPR